MTREQWAVLGLLVVLASLEVIRSPNVRGFFSSFFGQFGVGSSSSGNSSSATPPPHVNAPGSSSFKQQQATQTFRGMQNA